MTASEAKTRIQNANTPEDPFGDTLDAGELRDRYRELAAQVHPDKFKAAASKKKAEDIFAKLGTLRDQAEQKLADGTYGDRFAILKPITVTTKKDVYTVTRRLPAGDICEVYYATNKAGTEVALKVPRNPINNDLMDNEAKQLRWLRNEAKTKALEAMLHIPVLVDSFTLRQRGTVQKRVNAIKYAPYVTMAEIMSAYPAGIDIRDATWMFNRVAAALLIAHQAGLVHGAVIPSNILLCVEPKSKEEHNGILLDWKNAVEPGKTIKTLSTAYQSYYPQEIVEKRPVSVSADIYMLARCLEGLIGANNLRLLPISIQGLLRACWLGPRYRTKDIYKLYQDFAGLTGPRRFRRFEMPAGWKRR